MTASLTKWWFEPILVLKRQQTCLESFAEVENWQRKKTHVEVKGVFIVHESGFSMGCTHQGINVVMIGEIW